MTRKIKNNITPEVIAQLKSWEWDFIIDYGFNKINHLKGGQLNAMRGTYMEELISEQDDQLELLRQDHKDFYWHRFKLYLELKSQFSQSMYNKGGRLKDTYTVQLSNMRSKRKIRADQICDIILVLRSDGAFIIPKDTAVQMKRQKDKKVDIVVGSNQIIEISGIKSLSVVKQSKDINDIIKDFIRYDIAQARTNYYNRPK